MLMKKPRAVSRICAIALAITALSAHAETESPSRLASLDPAATGAPIAATPTPGEANGAQQVRLRVEKGYLKPGYENLRVVRRDHTMNNVAGQVALNVALSLVTRSVVVTGSGFSKDDLAGETLQDLKGDPVLANPATSDLRDALGDVASDIYRRRVAAARATALQDGSTPEEIAEASRMPQEADTPLYPGQWHLVYENLSGTDEMFRLRFGAELGRPGFMRPPSGCAWQSEPIAWTQWQADHWQRLRDERAKAVASCTKVLAGTPEKFW
ncbi:hypothetical protein [Variovorax sp. dw_308]|uniref:hypothetical protein n=1 Tax=Variovorax sp. dw_308 TaxID=2721546 RepID=UPI001C45D53C|nr:hypothetical protein [Variovorax sp. dw_308]